MKESKEAAILRAARERLRWIKKGYTGETDFDRGMRFAASLLRADMRSASIRHTKGQERD